MRKVKKVIKNLVARMPGNEFIFKFYRQLKLRYYYTLFKDKEAQFTDYYWIQQWSNEESVSGRGSTLAYTKKLRQQLPELIDEFNIESILDAPCGDYNWFRKVPLHPDVTYIGGDIVAPLVERNRRIYGDEQIRFLHLDITEDQLPEVNLWLCRDCLIHFSNKDIFKTLKQFCWSNIPYLLTTTYPDVKQNSNIATGEVRKLNLEKPPFNLPDPLVYLDDGEDEGYSKKLGLWEREKVIKRNDFSEP